MACKCRDTGSKRCRWEFASDRCHYVYAHQLDPRIERKLLAAGVELTPDPSSNLTEQLYFEAQAALDFELGALDPADYADLNSDAYMADLHHDEFDAAGIAWDTPTSAVYGTGFDYEALLDGFHVTARGGRRLLALVD